MMLPTLGPMDTIQFEQVSKQWLDSLRPEAKQQMGDSYLLCLGQMILLEDDGRSHLQNAASVDLDAEARCRTTCEAWLSEGSDAKGEQLRPTKIRAAWKSTSGGVAPPSTRHLAVQYLRHPHSTTSLPCLKVERELKPALRRSNSTFSRRSGQKITFEEDAKLCETRWFFRA